MLDAYAELITYLGIQAEKGVPLSELEPELKRSDEMIFNLANKMQLDYMNMGVASHANSTHYKQADLTRQIDASTNQVHQQIEGTQR